MERNQRRDFLRRNNMKKSISLLTTSKKIGFIYVTMIFVKKDVSFVSIFSLVASIFFGFYAFWCVFRARIIIDIKEHKIIIRNMNGNLVQELSLGKIDSVYITHEHSFNKKIFTINFSCYGNIQKVLFTDYAHSPFYINAFKRISKTLDTWNSYIKKQVTND